MRTRLSRRQFLGTSIRATSGLAAALYVGNGWEPPHVRFINERLSLAAIGVGNKGKHNIDQLADQAWVAFCDVDSHFLNQASTEFPNVKQFRDYREMFDQCADEIDGVVVSTADHTHAPATSLALSLGKHVYCEKPLTHTVGEARAISHLAREAGVATQMGTQIHAEENYRRVVELVRSGAIGRIQSVYNWCNKGWSNGRFQEGTFQVPDHLAWDLWLGPAPMRPYSPEIHPANWRRFWDYGSGTFGDMACHVMDLPFWALDLKYPTKVRCEGPELHSEGTPAWLRASYEFPTPDGPIELYWADGGENFDFVKQNMDAAGNPLASWGLGILFVGDEGMLAADYGRRQLLPTDKFHDFQPPEQSIEPSIGHWREWIQACQTGSATTCNFEYSGRLTEAVLLGLVAYRSGADIDWDAAQLVARGNPAASKFLTKEYRAGFEIAGGVTVG